MCVRVFLQSSRHRRKSNAASVTNQFRPIEHLIIVTKNKRQAIGTLHSGPVTTRGKSLRRHEQRGDDTGSDGADRNTCGVSLTPSRFRSDAALLNATPKRRH